jgi:hypothetical protein
MEAASLNGLRYVGGNYPHLCYVWKEPWSTAFLYELGIRPGTEPVMTIDTVLSPLLKSVCYKA